LAPQVSKNWSALGASHFRAGHWHEAVASLEKAATTHGEERKPAGQLFLSMAHWQMGNHEEARKCYDQAAASIKENSLDSDGLAGILAETQVVLEVASHH
jgi:uncharacterized protein HemY